MKCVQNEFGVCIILVLKGFFMWLSFDIIKFYLYGVIVSLVWEVKLVSEMGKEVYVFLFVYKFQDMVELVKLVNYILFNSLGQW